MPRMSASHGRAISAGSLRPNAAALDSKGLTRELGRSSTLTDDGVARSLGSRDMVTVSTTSIWVPFWSNFKKLNRAR